jgi:hypothetical protein
VTAWARRRVQRSPERAPSSVGCCVRTPQCKQRRDGAEGPTPARPGVAGLSGATHGPVNPAHAWARGGGGALSEPERLCCWQHCWASMRLGASAAAPSWHRAGGQEEPAAASQHEAGGADGRAPGRGGGGGGAPRLASASSPGLDPGPPCMCTWHAARVSLAPRSSTCAVPLRSRPTPPPPTHT